MNRAQILGLVRHVLTTVGGVLATFGWIDESTAAGLAGAIAVVVGGVWSMVDKLTD